MIAGLTQGGRKPVCRLRSLVEYENISHVRASLVPHCLEKEEDKKEGPFDQLLSCAILQVWSMVLLILFYACGFRLHLEIV